MSRAVKQCVDSFLKDHNVTLSPWQYKAMVTILSNREIYNIVHNHSSGKTFLFETIEQFLKERSDYVKSEITHEENFNNFRTGFDCRDVHSDHGL